VQLSGVCLRLLFRRKRLPIQLDIIPPNRSQEAFSGDIPSLAVRLGLAFGCDRIAFAARVRNQVY